MEWNCINVLILFLPQIKFLFMHATDQWNVLLDVEHCLLSHILRSICKGMEGKVAQTLFS